MIGTKTLAVVALLVVAVAVAVGLAVGAPERLAALDATTLLFLGAFGVVAGTLLYRFFRLGERSRHYFRWTREASPWDLHEAHFLGDDGGRIAVGKNERGEAVDLPRRANHAVAVLVASLLGLACLDGRVLERLGGIGQGASISSSYCPDEPPPKPPVRDANEPGCELIRRAYALGYAKRLGQCAPKKEQARAAARARPICTRRQRDEPVLHYSYRLLAGFFARAFAPSRAAAKAEPNLRARLVRLDALRRAERLLLTSAPHAAHHVWTNLPDPGDGAFRPRDCATRYTALPHRPAQGASGSQVFEHVLAQLLFEARYDTPVAHCREVHVHWGAPVDACKRLAEAPEAFLASPASGGALDDVRAVLERHRVGGELSSLRSTPPPPPVATVVSFQCYVEGAPAPRTSTPLTLDGQRFTADEVRVAPSPPKTAIYTDRYGAVAELLVSGFHYGAFLSEAGLEQAGAGALAPSFAKEAPGAGDWLLTRAFELESVDIYLDPGWLAARPDLLDVYPYERHLKNYVETFRRQYRRARGRL